MRMKTILVWWRGLVEGRSGYDGWFGLLWETSFCNMAHSYFGLFDLLWELVGASGHVSMASQSSFTDEWKWLKESICTLSPFFAGVNAGRPCAQVSHRALCTPLPCRTPSSSSSNHSSSIIRCCQASSSITLACSSSSRRCQRLSNPLSRTTPVPRACRGRPARTVPSCRRPDIVAPVPSSNMPQHKTSIGS